MHALLGCDIKKVMQSMAEVQGGNQDCNSAHNAQDSHFIAPSRRKPESKLSRVLKVRWSSRDFAQGFADLPMVPEGIDNAANAPAVSVIDRPN
jgi:hypothetical protein